MSCPDDPVASQRVCYPLIALASVVLWYLAMLAVRLLIEAPR